MESSGVLSCLRSTVFLASFCAMYQTIICMQRNFVSRDHRIVYLLAGIISSFSIFIEKKGRRSGTIQRHRPAARAHAHTAPPSA
jgi:hypothetical protein